MGNAMTYSRRFLVVIRSDLAAAANAAVKDASVDPIGGDKTWTVGLSATGTAPAQAYWCSIALTPAMATAIRSRLQAAGATVAEVTPVPAGQTPASNRVAVFDADVWPIPDAVLVACGLKRVEAPL